MARSLRWSAHRGPRVGRARSRNSGTPSRERTPDEGWRRRCPQQPRRVVIVSLAAVSAEDQPPHVSEPAINVLARWRPEVNGVAWEPGWVSTWLRTFIISGFEADGRVTLPLNPGGNGAGRHPVHRDGRPASSEHWTRSTPTCPALRSCPGGDAPPCMHGVMMMYRAGGRARTSERVASASAGKKTPEGSTRRDLASHHGVVGLSIRTAHTISAQNGGLAYRLLRWDAARDKWSDQGGVG
jgi:hypothetical protein